MDRVAVDLKDVSFCRGERTILSEVNWRIEGEDHWVLLGANGSGKTSLLKIITGYEWPTFGSVSLFGRRYGECDLREIRKVIGWVSSSMALRLPQNDSAAEIAASGIEASVGLFRKFSDEELSRAREALCKVKAGHIAEQNYGTLSQGEQQKVLIARALVCEPKLLILDEPCVGLDPAARELFLHDVGELAKSSDGPGIILVTHHIEEILPWISQSLLLKDGKVLAKGRCEEMITSEKMSELFDCACVVNSECGRYSLSIKF